MGQGMKKEARGEGEGGKSPSLPNNSLLLKRMAVGINASDINYTSGR